MTLSHDEINNLLRLVARTHDVELTCDQCLALVAEFAEQQMAGKSVGESLRAVEQHLSICAECEEEFKALRRTLKDESA